jgi:DNA-binding response OmpR family regulator
MIEPKIKKKVLVIDDEESITKLLKILLEKEGYEVIIANNGFEGIERTRSEKPDLVITDLMMSGINGYQIIFRLLHEEYLDKDPKFIVLTGRSKRKEEDLSNKLGACTYLEKPFKSEVLIDLVRKII